MSSENIVLCGASAYEQKYYLNPQFEGLPQAIQEELKVLCVLFTEDVGGILTLEFTPEGELQFAVRADEGDLLFDDIGCELKIKELRRTKEELLRSLEMFYKIMILKEDIKIDE